MLIYHNQNEFLKDEFNNNSIRKRSYLHKIRSFLDKPEWNEGFININEVDDFVSLF